MRELAPVAEILDRMAARAVHLGQELPSEGELVLGILTRLPRIAGCLGAGETAAAADLVEELVHQVNGLITRLPDQTDFVTAMMKDCNELGLVGRIWPGPDSTGLKEPDDSAKPRRTGRGLIYIRRKGPDGKMVLAESRPHASGRDFLISQEDYSRAVNAVAKVVAGKPVKFPVIYEQFAVDHQPSEYVLRVLLRFWRSRKPPLVQRERARYQAVGPVNKFRAAAKKAWDELPEM